MPEGNIGIVEREQRLRREYLERQRRAKIARAHLKRQGTKVGPVEEDGSFRVGKTGTFDPETKHVRVPVSKQAGPHPKGKTKPLAEKPTYSTKRPKDAAAKLAAARTQARQRQGYKTIKQLQAEGERSHRQQLAAALPGVSAKDVREAEDAIVGLPAGLYGLGRDVALDVVKPKGGPFDVRHSRTGHNLAEMGKLTYRDIRHPLRNPLLTALTASAVVGVGAGTGARLGAASAAAKAARVAGESAPKAAAGALLKRPIPPPRTHLYEGEKVAGRYSTSAAARGVQKLHDKAALKRAQYRVEAGKAERLSTIRGKKAARLLSEERRVNRAKANAPILRLAAMEKGVSTPQQLAIDVVGSGLPVEEHIATLRSAAAKAKGRARHRLTRRAQLLEGAKEYLALDADGRPIIAPKYPKLQKVARKAEAVSKRREKRLIRVGVLSKKGAEERIHAPGRVILGAKFQPKSLAEGTSRADLQIGKRVVTGDGVRGVIVDVKGDKAIIRPWSKKLPPKIVSDLTDTFPATRKVQGGRLVGGGRAVERERPRTLNEAKAELATLEARIDRLSKPIIDRMYQENRDAYELRAKGTEPAKARGAKEIPKGVELPRYKHGGQLNVQKMEGLREYTEEAARKANVAPRKHQSARQLAEEDFWHKVATSKHETAKRLSDMAEEAYQLRQAVGEHEAPAFMREANLPGLGTTKETIAFEQFAGGRFRVAEARKAKLPKGQAAFRGGVPRRPGTLTNPYTGALRSTARNTTEVIRAIVEDALDAERWMDVERFRQQVIPMGRGPRPADTRFVKYGPVRVGKLKPADSKRLSKMLEDVVPERLTPDEAARIEAALDQYREHLFPEKEFATTPVGEEIPGVVWVDKRLLESNRKIIGSLGPIDVVQDATKALILYAKPGYAAPNILGNVGLNLIQQGFLAPANWTRAARVGRELGFQIDEVMGAGYARALAYGNKSAITGTVHAAGNFWSMFVDEPFRRAAFIHEARRYGFKTREQMRALIEDPQYAQLSGEIIQRAKDSIIDYERLGPIERDLVRRMVFVYPWIKGSTYYAAQFLRDHPILAAVFAKMGQEGTARSQQQLGPVPAWARGSFKVFERNGTPFVVNPTAISPFQTPAQVMAAARGSFGGVERSEQLGEMTSPVFQSAVEAAFGRDLFTGRELTGGYGRSFAGQLGKGLPQYTLYKRLRAAENPKTQEKAYPFGYGSALGQFIGGSSAPRPVNLQTLNEQAAGSQNPYERIKKRTTAEHRDVMAGLNRHAPSLLEENPSLRKRISEAYGKRQQVETARERVRLDVGTGEPYARAVLVEEAKLLRSWGVISPKKQAEIAKVARTGSLADVEEWRGILSNDGFEEQYLALLREARDKAGVK